ncbi:DNA polymerase III subunit alpha [Pyrinomonas methylaliphatogenes]|uniref:DNA polymerase III subunit alpha n=1 Tax=Pyrinomonas methylaliphatogenes TaxID=454194 RepID=A0A0B6WUA2_9BACT|nr:DNA polymerase III subunit alpha [Pyrinomonas methylaliphatogenes]CDM64813.1 DNA-directed DNA polymerase III PolC [Pyrinomonas methylaliphatogenes]
MRDFVHLHLHTDYSLLDAANQIKPLARRIAELGMRACAITDHGNLFGAISFYHTMREHGIKPIIGCEVYYTRGDRRAPQPGEKLHHMVLLAKDLEGYHNLVRLVSRAYTEGFYRKPRIDRELLARYSGGLIGLSACLSGVVPALLLQDKEEEARLAAHEFEEILGRGNFYLEVQEHEMELQREANRRIVELARRTRLPLVATNDAHYLRPEDARAHDILLCIGSGKTVNDPHRLRYGAQDFYVRSPEEMWAIWGGELPEALENSLRIAERCELELPQGINHVPLYPVPDGRSVEEYFEEVVRDGYERRRRTVWEPLIARGELRHTLAEYQERLSREVAIIRQMGFASYFLIVWDFVRYARENAIPVGPGRGSAAGSLVAYCLEITDVDPLQYDLLFERFLNPERVTMPDIDIDFCVRGRERVIEHVAQVYGHDSVCQIITFGTLASRAVVKDVGRALEMPYAEVERIAKMIPPPVRGRNVSIAQALEQVPELREAVESDARVRELIDLAQRLEGCARHSSVHAAGVVIAPRPLEELVPVAVSPRGERTTQYAMADLERTGILKMDFLALTTLTIISDCIKSIKQSLNIEIDWSRIPTDDPATMRLFAEGRTEAIFQFESPGMQEICRRLKPKNLEDLAALNALYRPGPLDGGMVEDFIARHHGERAVRYIVPQMKGILANTYGIIVYQEQIMQLAQQLAGYSLGEADLMRRAMGKKKREEMARHREKFVRGCIARGIPEAKAEQIFQLMAQFADYGFNRSHSVAYAYLAFQTAYLKAHYPEHFYAAVLSNEAEDTAKVLKYAKELREQGIRLLPPDVNESGAGFTPLRDRAIRYGLAAIKGLGQASVEAIIEARARGPFRSLFDFASRVRSLNRRTLESLIGAGALDCLAPSGSAHERRARLMATIERALAVAARAQRASETGQSGLFGEAEHEEELLPAEAWSPAQLLAAEKEALGFYVTGHPLDGYDPSSLGCVSIAEAATREGVASICGIITELQVRTTKRGERFALFRLEDQSGRLRCVLWPEWYARFRALLANDVAVLARGRLETGEESGATLIVDELERLDEAPKRLARALICRLPDLPPGGWLEELLRVLHGHKGECEVLIEMEVDGRARVLARTPVRVRGGVELERELERLGCRLEWRAANGR